MPHQTISIKESLASFDPVFCSAFGAEGAQHSDICASIWESRSLEAQCWYCPIPPPTIINGSRTMHNTNLKIASKFWSGLKLVYNSDLQWLRRRADPCEPAMTWLGARRADDDGDLRKAPTQT